MSPRSRTDRQAVNRPVSGRAISSPTSSRTLRIRRRLRRIEAFDHLEQLGLALEDTREALVDRALAHEVVHVDTAPLTYAHNPVASLAVGRRVPPVVDEQHVVRLRERQSLAGDAGGGEQHGDLRVAFEFPDDALALGEIEFLYAQSRAQWGLLRAASSASSSSSGRISVENTTALPTARTALRIFAPAARTASRVSALRSSFALAPVVGS